MKIRSWLYRLARWMGDVGAIFRGTVGSRIARRTLGRILSSLFRS